MKVLLDTNVILDVLASREPFLASAATIFALAGKKKFAAYVTASSVTDLYYILRRKLPNDVCREALRNLFNLCSAIPVTQRDCQSALDDPVDDFEDALMMVYGRKIGVDYVITRDEIFLKTKGTISPLDFLKIYSF
jgi:predicted nucleic acid-binding protein